MHHNFIFKKRYYDFPGSKKHYYVMEHVQGGDLFSLLKREGKIPLNAVTFYAAEVVLALEYLHDRNTIYRDLKPENVLLNERGHAKLCDFGFIKHLTRSLTFTQCGFVEYISSKLFLQCEYINL